MNLKIIGCGEAFDQNYGNNACLLFGKNIPTVLFDCGYQIPERLWKLGPLYQRIDALYFTHTHADHIFGVVALLARYWEENRTSPLLIMGPRGIKSFTTRLLQMGYPGMLSKLSFPLEFEEHSNGDEWNWRGLKFRCARSQHSVLNLSVRVWGPTGKSFAVSGDGQLTNATRQLFEGVDLLLHEVYTLKPEIPSHCDLQTLASFAAQNNVKQVVLTHPSRLQRKQIQKVIEKQKGHGPRWTMALPFAVYKLSTRS